MSRINRLMEDVQELADKNDFCNMKIEWDELFSSFVKLLSYRSTCGSAKNAAVLVRDNRIVSIGYNGAKSGYTNCNKENLELDSSGSCLKCIHAEQNCLGYAARNGIETEGCTIYCTMTPCLSCAKIMIAAGISTYKYLIPYRLTEGVEYLKRYGVGVMKLI